MSLLAWGRAALRKLAPTPTGPAQHPAVIVLTAQRNGRSRVTPPRIQRAVITDENGITAVGRVVAQITTSDRSVRFTAIDSTATRNSANQFTIDFEFEGRARAGANNLLIVTLTYTDAIGTYTVTAQATFETV